jgi:hypothetical protein
MAVETMATIKGATEGPTTKARVHRTADVRFLFKADAAFEAGLGLLLAVGGGSGWPTGSDFPVTRGVLIAAGAAFLLASASVLLYFVRGPRRVLRELAAGNAAMASAGLIWLIAAQGFSATGTAILAVAVAWKFVIGALQLRSTKASDSQTTD